MSASFWCFEYEVFTWFEIMAIEFWYKGWEVSPSQVYSPLPIHLLLVTCSGCPLSRYSWSGYPWSVYPWPGYPYVLIPQIWIPPSWDTSGRDLLHALDPQTSIRLTVDSKKSETLKKPTTLTEHVFDICRHYWVDHKPKFFRSCLVLGGAAIIFPKRGQNQEWKKIY